MKWTQIHYLFTFKNQGIYKIPSPKKRKKFQFYPGKKQLTCDEHHFRAL